MDRLPEDASAGSLAVLSRFRLDLHACLTARADELCELADAVLCTDGPVKTLAGLSLAPEHQPRTGQAPSTHKPDTGRRPPPTSRTCAARGRRQGCLSYRRRPL
jgi:hypothetical protein